MFVIGEKINGMFTRVQRAIEQKDSGSIQDIARQQLAGGADALDVNVGPACDSPEKTLRWLVDVIAEVTDVPVSLDSPNPDLIARTLPHCKSPVIINSTTADDEKLNKLLPLAAEYRCRLIALTLDKSGVPSDAQARLELAAKIIARCQESGFEMENLFIDPVVLPVSAAQEHTVQVLEALRQIKLLTHPAPKTIIGLSNISQGAESRSLLNGALLVMAMACGLDAALLDPTDVSLRESYKTAEVLLNRTIYCDAFLRPHRE